MSPLTPQALLNSNSSLCPLPHPPAHFSTFSPCRLVCLPYSAKSLSLWDILVPEERRPAGLSCRPALCMGRRGSHFISLLVDHSSAPDKCRLPPSEHGILFFFFFLNECGNGGNHNPSTARRPPSRTGGPCSAHTARRVQAQAPHARGPSTSTLPSSGSPPALST